MLGPTAVLPVPQKAAAHPQMHRQQHAGSSGETVISPQITLHSSVRDFKPQS